MTVGIPNRASALSRDEALASVPGCWSLSYTSMFLPLPWINQYPFTNS